MKKLLVTGASGFVGGAVVRVVSEHSGQHVTAGVRQVSEALPQHIPQVLVGDLLADTDYSSALKGMDIVVHASARVHTMQDNAIDPLAEFRKVNVEGTLNLARQAVRAGVYRFIFLSSIGVNGASTCKPFTEEDEPHPHDTYSIAKYEAECVLLELGKETGLEVVIIRPPLVYARHAPGNFKRLIKWVDKGIPLPLGAVYNQRSLVALDNLVDFIVLCTIHPNAAGEVFLISDGEDISTTELLKKVSSALGKRPCLVPVPVSLMRLVAGLLGGNDIANRLFGSLQVDNSKACKLLGWKPVVTIDGQLKKMPKE